jgi:hypothetical protein
MNFGRNYGGKDKVLRNKRGDMMSENIVICQNGKNRNGKNVRKLKKYSELYEKNKK